MSAAARPPPAETPQTVRLLRDALEYQVMPSRKPMTSAERDVALMPPPPPKALLTTGARVKEAGSATRAVLDEAAYEEALGAIIERDFYPDLPKLQQQLEWLQALDSGDEARIADARSRIATAVRRSDAFAAATTPAQPASASASSAAAAAAVAGRMPAAAEQAGSRAHLIAARTPLRRPEGAETGSGNGSGSGGGGGGGAAAEDEDDAASLVSWSAEAMQPSAKRRRTGALDSASVAGSAAATASGGAGGGGLDAISLDQFQAQFVSEDTRSFDENAASRLQAVRRAHWWLHEPVTVDRWRLMLTDGGASRAASALLLADHNIKGVKMLEDPGFKALGGDTKGVVHTAPYRPRNALFFPPDLAASNETSGVTAPAPNPDLPAAGPGSITDASSAPTALLTDGTASSTVLSSSQRALSAGYSGLDLAFHSSHSSHSSGSSGAIRHRAPARTNFAATRMRPQLLQQHLAAPTPSDRTPASATSSALLLPPAVRAAMAARQAAAAAAAPPVPGAASRGGAGGGAGIGGYSLVATPQLLPGAGMTPMMTWGEIEGTPMMLDPPPAAAAPPAPAAAASAAPSPAAAALMAAVESDAPLSARELAAAFAADSNTALDLSGRPSLFTVQHTSAREVTRDALLDKVNSRKRKREGSGTGASSSSATPVAPAAATPGSAVLTRGVLRTALATTRAGVMSAALSAHAHRTPLFAAGATPALTPGLGPGAASSAASVVSSATSHATSSSSARTKQQHALSLSHLPPAARAIAQQVAAQRAATAASLLASSGSGGSATSGLIGGGGFGLRQAYQESSSSRSRSRSRSVTANGR